MRDDNLQYSCHINLIYKVIRNTFLLLLINVAHACVDLSSYNKRNASEVLLPVFYHSCNLQGVLLVRIYPSTGLVDGI